MRESLEESVKLKTPSEGASTSELSGRLNSWLAKEGISNYLSPQEKDLVGKTLGSWTMEEIVASGWRTERAPITRRNSCGDRTGTWFVKNHNTDGAIR